MSIPTLEKMDKYIRFIVVFIPLIYLPIFLTQMYLGFSRPAAFTGNAILLSGEMLFTFFVNYHYWKKYKKDIYAISAIASFFMLLFGHGRSAYLALFTALIVYLYDTFTTD